MPTDLQKISLKVSTYKCFGDNPQGFDHILPFNIIIGRNNTGKSALLDLLAHIVTRQNNQRLELDGKNATVTISAPITKEELERIVSNEWGNPEEWS